MEEMGGNLGNSTKFPHLIAGNWHKCWSDPIWTWTPGNDLDSKLMSPPPPPPINVTWKGIAIMGTLQTFMNTNMTNSHDHLRTRNVQQNPTICLHSAWVFIKLSIQSVYLLHLFIYFSLSSSITGQCSSG
jgi:hypothetical protein